MKILLTGARAPVTLDLARHFRRAGHEVFLADSVCCPMARPTRAARRTLRVSPPAQNPARFIEDLVAIVRRWKIDWIIPTCEEIFFIAARLDAFRGLAAVFAEPLSRLELLHNKWRFNQLVQKMDGAADAPESRLLQCEADLLPWQTTGDAREWVFKPVFSRFAARTVIAPQNGQLQAIRPTVADPWIAQQLLRGEEYSTYSVARGGRLRAHACYRSLYRAGRGSGIYFVPVDSPRIDKFVEELVDRLQFTGQIGFDFIASEDGRLYVLECNPRATSGVHLLDAEPLAAAFLQDQGPVLKPTSGRPSMLAAVMLLYALPKVRRPADVWRLFHDMAQARDVSFTWQDPLPSLISPLSLCEVMLTACRTRKPLTHAATFDIEWNGEPL